MFDYETYEKKRHENMRQYGFGPEVMREIKICGNCGARAEAWQRRCRECGGKLPKDTLFDRYKQMHQCCAYCQTVVAVAAGYCPQCGSQLK